MTSYNAPLKRALSPLFEDEQMHYFYVDTAELAGDEFAEDDGDDWPIYVEGSGCSNPLPADGSPQGELSCWIIRAGCIGEEYSSARFRIEDDCGNWTRSENMVPGTEMSIVITNPEVESEFEYGVPVVFDAEIIPSNAYPGMEERIKWSILAEENSVWVDYGPHEEGQYLNWEDKTDSIISEEEDWLGPDFEIESFEDCDGLRVRARLEMCETVYDDICTIYIVGRRGGQSLSDSFTVQQIGVVIANTHEIEPYSDNAELLITPDNQCIDAPVLKRTSGACLIDYACRVTRPDPCVDFPEYIDTQVTCVSDEHDDPGDTIMVRLFSVDNSVLENDDLYPEDPGENPHPRYRYFHELFNEYSESIEAGINIRYYARGQIADDAFAIKLRIDDMRFEGQSRSQGSNNLSVPSLYVNDRDYDANGDPCEIKDYSLVLGNDNAYWEDYIKDVYYGDNQDHSNKRGFFNPVCDLSIDPESDFCSEKKKNYFSDLTQYGFEVVRISVDSDDKDCSNPDIDVSFAVQSRGDLLFIASHADWNLQPDVLGATSLGPFYSGETTGGDDEHYFTREQFSQTDFSKEIEWFVTSACGVLNDDVWEDWRDDLINKQGSNLKSICCFFGLTQHNYIFEDSKLMSGFSDDLNNPPAPIFTRVLWKDGSTFWFTSVDECIKAWMQNACRISRNVILGRNEDDQLLPISQAVACDSQYRYLLEETYAQPRESWYCEIQWYYIYRD